MSSCCSSVLAGAREQFSAALAEGDLKRYRRGGLRATTRLLREGVLAAGGGRTVLDIGAGIGALSLELMAGGFERSTLVDLSPAYLAAARRVASERNREDRLDIHEGDFVDLAPRLPAADAVVLDRVVCCYPAYRPLLEAALEKSLRVLAFSFPRDRWVVRLGLWLENLMSRLRGRAFRAYMHDEGEMAALVESRGFRRASRERTFLWCAEVYVRNGREAQAEGPLSARG